MQITNDFVESLLWSDEGTTLDFKKEQYLFSGASDVEKSELLKDVLAFANAFRREDAFILLGVEDVQGGRGNVVGVSHHIDDSRLQQFINGKVQRPIVFSYRAIEHDGLPVGIIHIPKQKRPFYAKADYGKVAQGTVYVRRGSSTAIALPDEVAAMGADQIASHAAEPALSFSLWDRETGQSLGTSRDIACIVLDCPADGDIPDYSENRGPFEIALTSANSDFHREVAEYARTQFLIKPLSFSITNMGDVTAQDVRFVIEVNDPDENLIFMKQSQLPEAPVKRSNTLQRIAGISHLHTTHSAFSIERIGNVWRIECGFGKIQPQDTVRISEDLHVGSYVSVNLSLEMRIFADNLCRPTTALCQLRFLAETHEVTVTDIVALDFKRLVEAREALEQTFPA